MRTGPNANKIITYGFAPARLKTMLSHATWAQDVLQPLDSMPAPLPITSTCASVSASSRGRQRMAAAEQPLQAAADSDRPKRHRVIAGSIQQTGTAECYRTALSISPTAYQVQLPDGSLPEFSVVTTRHTGKPSTEELCNYCDSLRVRLLQQLHMLQPVSRQMSSFRQLTQLLKVLLMTAMVVVLQQISRNQTQQQQRQATRHCILRRCQQQVYVCSDHTCFVALWRKACKALLWVMCPSKPSIKPFASSRWCSINSWLCC